MKNKQVNVKDKIAFVSGANRGIGKAITIELLEKGAKKVYAGARKPDSLQALKEKYEGRLVPVALDVTNDDSIASAAQQAPDVEILVNNAGVFEFGNFTNGNLLESLKANLDVNVWGLVKLTNAFLGNIRNQEEGAIVSVSSVAGLANMPVGLTYSVSKAAVHSVVQGLRGELQDSNILVSGVYPGPIDTDMAKDFEMDKDSPENVAKNVIQAMNEGTEDIFPDAMSQQVGAGFFASPKALEEQFASFG